MLGSEGGSRCGAAPMYLGDRDLFVAAAALIVAALASATPDEYFRRAQCWVISELPIIYRVW